MSIGNVAKNFDPETQWLACTRTGKISIVTKDTMFVRWLKVLFQILTLNCVDVYGHVRIKRVAQGLFEHFERDVRYCEDARKNYKAVIDKLLLLEFRPIRSDRAELLKVRQQIDAYPQLPLIQDIHQIFVQFQEAVADDPRAKEHYETLLSILVNQEKPLGGIQDIYQQIKNYPLKV